MTHEGPLDLVRQHPEIAVDLIQNTLGIDLPGEVAVALAPTDMSAVVPQLRDSETKRYSWPVYVTTARRVAQCPAAVLVARHLAPSEEQRQRVTSCADSVQLNLWFDRAITASTAAGVFAG